MNAKIWMIFLGAWLLIGCVKQPSLSTEGVIATLRTQQVALHETAFLIRENRDRYRLQIYVAGQAAYEVRAGTMICVQDRCMDRREFNARHLSNHYPETLIIDVLAARPIRGLPAQAVSTAKGFVQRHTLEGRYAIEYEKNAQGVRFVDRHNRIVIAIRKLEG